MFFNGLNIMTLNRRCLLVGAIATLLSGPALAATDSESGDLEDADPYWLPAIEALDKFLSVHPQRIVVMGWQHDDPALQKFLRCRQMANVIKRHFKLLGEESQLKLEGVTLQETSNPWFRTLAIGGVEVVGVDYSPEGKIVSEKFANYYALLKKRTEKKFGLDSHAFETAGAARQTEMMISTYNELKHSKNQIDQDDFTKLQQFHEGIEFDYGRLYDVRTAEKIKSLVSGIAPETRIFVTFGGGHLSECAVSLKKQLGEDALVFQIVHNRSDIAAYHLGVVHPEVFPGLLRLPFEIAHMLSIDDGRFIEPPNITGEPSLVKNCTKLVAPR